jgi:hypothetical protein
MNFSDVYSKVVEWSNTTMRIFVGKLKHVSIESLGWAAMLLLHAVTVPSLLGLMTGMTDATPPIDMILILWAGLALFYVKAIIQRDIVPIIIIGAGFVGQAILMALVFFK